MTTSVRLMIDGMTCANCERHVTNALSELEGVEKVAITLNPEGTSEVVVHLLAPVPEAVFRDAIDEAGYTLVGVG